MTISEIAKLVDRYSIWDTPIQSLVLTSFCKTAMSFWFPPIFCPWDLHSIKRKDGIKCETKVYSRKSRNRWEADMLKMITKSSSLSSQIRYLLLFCKFCKIWPFWLYAKQCLQYLFQWYSYTKWHFSYFGRARLFATLIENLFY